MITFLMVNDAGMRTAEKADQTGLPGRPPAVILNKLQHIWPHTLSSTRETRRSCKVRGSKVYFLYCLVRLVKQTEFTLIYSSIHDQADRELLFVRLLRMIQLPPVPLCRLLHLL